MAEVPMEVQKMFAKIFGEMEQQRRENERAAAKADPKRHALSRVMEGNTNYGYLIASERRLKRKRLLTHICVATHRNVAGNFLLWRQVDTYGGKRLRHWRQSERFDFKWAPTKREAWQIAHRWRDRLQREATERDEQAQQKAFERSLRAQEPSAMT